MPKRFAVSTLFWLTLVIALACGWWYDHDALREQVAEANAKVLTAHVMIIQQQATLASQIDEAKHWKESAVQASDATKKLLEAEERADKERYKKPPLQTE